MKTLFLLAFLALASLSFSLSNVSTCQVLDNISDSSYVLNADLAGAPNPGAFVALNACIRINGSNIVLDCNGFSITDNGTAGATAGILMERANNVTVKNCPSISAYGNGLYNHQSNGSLIANVTAHNISNNAFAVVNGFNNSFSGDTALNSTNGFTTSSNASDNDFTGNTAFDIGSFAFELSPDCDNNVLSGNIVNGSIYGFYLNSASGNNLTNNSVYNSTDGFLVDAGSAGNLLEGNTASNNSDNGFTISSSSGNTADGNNASGNGNDGFFLIVSLFGSPGGNTLSGNTASGNGNDGFGLTFSDNNTLTGNTASGNGGNGFELADSSGNNLSGNAVSGGTRGFFLFSGSSGNTVSGNNVSGTSSNAVFTGDNNIFIGNIVSGSFEGFGVGANNVLTGNIVSGVAAFGGFRLESLSPNNILTDNTVFNSDRGLEILSANNTTVTNQHLYNNSIDFLTSAGAGDITENLSGVIFDGPSDGLSDYTNLSISDILENGSTYSIDHAPNPGSSPTANHVSFANKFVTITSLTPGVSIDSITWNWQDSELTSYNENNFELWKLDSGNWTLQNASPDTAANTLSLSNLDNFSVFGIFDTASNITDCQNISSPGNYVLGNDIIGANISGAPNFAGNACIRISVPNVLLDCKGFSITGNGGTSTAVLAEESGGGALSNVVVDNCVASNYTQGITVLNTSGASLAGNTAHGNGGRGFVLDTVSDSTLSGNEAYGNGDDNFFLSSSSSNTLAGNSAHDSQSGPSGFELFNSDGNTLTGNTAVNNSYGFTLGNSSLNTMSGNNASSNTFFGIGVLSGSDSNNIADSNASDNVLDGIVVSDSSGNTIDPSVFCGNGGDGIDLLSAPGTTVADSISCGNAGAGVSLFDSNLTTLSGLHLYGNNPDLNAESDFSRSFILNLSGVIFDNPSGNLSNYTSISLNDDFNLDSSLMMNWSGKPAPLPPSRASFLGKFIKISRNFGSPVVDSILWNWLDLELNASNESSFELWKNNGTWIKLNATLDTASNTLSLADLDSFSTFAILEAATAPPPSGGGGGPSGGGSSTPALAISFDSATSIVTVTSDGSPVPGATVKVDGSIAGTTDSDGQVTIPGCNGTITIDALKSGFTAATATGTLHACPASCSDDSGCPASSMCSAGQCVLVNCPDGTVVNHACVVPQNNTQNQTACTAPSCCTSSGQCLDSQACVSATGAPATASSPGSCQQVSGSCGIAANHTFVPYGYECGTEPGCPSCPQGASCQDHKCVQYGLSCPAGGLVGAQATCNATVNGNACVNCDYKVTDPSGSTTTGKTGPDGSLSIPLSSKGSYTVSIMSSGSPVKSVQVTASPASQPSEPTKPAGSGGADFSWLLWLVVILLIVGGVFLYLRSRKGGKAGN